MNPNQMPPVSSMSVDQNKKSMGPLLAVIIILALIIIGGLYFLKNRVSNEQAGPQNDSVVESLNMQSENDDLGSIEADLNASDFNNLDQGAAVIEAELQ